MAGTLPLGKKNRIKFKERPYLSRKEVAELFCVSPSTITRWAKIQKLPSVCTLGGQRRYPRQEIERLVRELFGKSGTDQTP
ncbi:MAG: helix-turn-helix domain-containing protein [Armatimonadota bacterium]|nr:helix-turn-helix domain-containing protein [Armatimonadota bacterium]MDR7440088.1 helix-turn-helix domain-containing protein [Armatimonadota bacterium]MDR7563576.1 helix-turn-helix domain-containing protein [Armatimonadota bacterium]MDR7568236.1 helix-turn-helix domain-containing protein [Armatimonadota bacterium]MDR7602188.1 helix-turn-helix domain-containing protein [Armatimonadota bacterium]